MSLTLTITATDGATSQITLAAPVVNAGSGLPAGVTLQAIDGEVMTSPTVMSNNYYARNGYTAASNWGWDSPNFIPQGPIDAVYSDSLIPGCTAMYNDVGWNTLFGEYNEGTDWDRADMVTNHIGGIPESDGAAISPTNYGGAQFVGILTADEPHTWPGISGGFTKTTNAEQDSRWWWWNATWQGLGAPLSWEITSGLPSGVTTIQQALAYQFTTPNGKKRKVDLFSIDLYWFCGSRDSSWSGYMLGSGSGGAGSAVLGTSPMTADQCQRGTNYGNLIDLIRAKQPSGTGQGTAPIGVYLENGDAFTADSGGTAYIKAHEIPWSMWSIFIHGGRMIYWFDHSFSGPGAANNNFAQSSYYKTIHTGETQSAYNAVKTTNQLINQLAPVINSPFALGYVSVTPAGYSFPTFNNSFNTGIDICAHWYQGGNVVNKGLQLTNGFYIFATTRASQTVNNISATFTIADKTATLATVVGEGRTIPINNGVFTDTFATAATVHIYQVN